jgi:hypothetical protein
MAGVRRAARERNSVTSRMNAIALSVQGVDVKDWGGLFLVVLGSDKGEASQGSRWKQLGNPKILTSK